MGADLSELSPRGDEEHVDHFSTDFRNGPVEREDTSEEPIFGHWLIDGMLGWLSLIFWWWPLYIFIIPYWLFFM